MPDTRNKRHLLKYGLPLLLAWSLAWLSGISILANIAIDQRDALLKNDLDTELALYATTVYGLTWFDENGAFHTETLRLENDFQDAPYDIQVVEPGNPPIQHLSPARPRFDIPDFSHLYATVLGQGQSVYLDGKDTNGSPYRLHAIPTFMDQGDTNKPKAMIITLADPGPWQASYQTFVHQIIRASLLLGALGLLVGGGLSWWSLRPAFASLRQRERFIAATAHELRTPLAALRSINESALQGDEPPQQALARMHDLLQNTSHTVDDLLLFARLDAGMELQRQPTRLDLLAETLLPENSAVRLEAEASIANIDPRLASVAMRNLIANARRHSSAAEQDIQIHITGASVTVTDSGKGFPAELLTHRQHDFTLSPSTGGHGLGLAITNLIMRLHGGELRLENLHPHGARATLVFPQ